MTDREKFELEMEVKNLRWENAILIKKIKALKKAEKILKNTIDFLRKELKENDRINHKNIDN